MSIYLGIDTSNYTTSVAVYNSVTNEMVQSKKLLPVKQGELGLRQSDAVFAHVKQLSLVLEEIKNTFLNQSIKAIGVSVSPRNIEGSYMPCFLVGKMVADSLSMVMNLKTYEFSHQQGHVVAALYSTNKTDLFKSKFLTFHVSGGTTECLLATPSDNGILDFTLVGKTLDLNAGQIIDRVGTMLGLPFPSGKYLDELSLQGKLPQKAKPCLKQNDCCLSGVENKCHDMMRNGVAKQDIARFAIEFVKQTVCAMLEKAYDTVDQKLPVIFAGGVMSNTIIREYILSHYKDVYFAKPEYSCDNATGLAYLASIKDNSNE